MKNTNKLSSLLLTAALTVAVIGAGCTSEQAPIFGASTGGTTGGTGGTTTTGTTGGGTTTTTTGGTTTGGSTTGATLPSNTQVEQLARPAIAEGLLFTNSNLNTYNAVSPSFVAAALANSTSPQGLAAAPVLKEAETTLGLLVALAPAGKNLTVGALAGAFLPDVMRIDTTLNLEPTPGTEKSAYAAEVNKVGSPVGGRKLTDDVVDITFQVLTGGTLTGDGVPYYRPATGAGSTNTAIGHQFLNNQTVQFGTSTFPFLAPAN